MIGWEIKTMIKEMKMKITRGTTPLLNFVLPFNYEAISGIYVTFTQNGEKIIQLTNSDFEVVPLLAETENSDITDSNHGDEFISNDIDFEGYEVGEGEEEFYIACILHLTQEQTLVFTFWPAAEKNIAVVQFKVLVNEDNFEEVYISNPTNFRIYGDLDGEVRGQASVVPGEEENEES